MKLPKLKKEHICTTLQIGYHFLFIGGATTLGNHYLEELEKTRETIMTQVNRAEKVLKNVQDSGDQITKELKKVRKACGRIYDN